MTRAEIQSLPDATLVIIRDTTRPDGRLTDEWRWANEEIEARAAELSADAWVPA